MRAILEKVELSDHQAVHAFIYEKGSFIQPWHFHPEYELTLILKSSGIRYVGNDISDYVEGDLVLLGSNLPHCWKNSEEYNGRCKSLVIQWRKEIMHDIPIFSRINELLQKSQRGLFIRQDTDSKIATLMHQVEASDAVHQYLYFLELLDCIASEADYEYLAGASYSYDLSNATTSRLELIQSFVKQHYREKIKLQDVADELSMSEQSFSRFFSKTMSKPFFEFVNQYRVNIASRQILETDLQIAEVAYKCGYESLPFFHKQFKKFKGFTPLEFRKMYRKL